MLFETFFVVLVDIVIFFHGNMDHLPAAPGSYVDISVYNPDIEFFLEKFRKKEYFALVRYQDQWWESAVRGIRNCETVEPHHTASAFSKNYNHTAYMITHDVAYENFSLLAQSRPNFFVTIKCMNEKFSQHIPRLVGDKEFLYAHCWRQMSTNGTIIDMFDEFRDENFIIIGPHYLKNFGTKVGLKNWKHVKISGTEACNHFEKTIAEVLHLYKQMNNPNKRMFILSVGGYFGNAVINRLYDQIHDAFLIEMGRALDAFYCHDAFFRSLPKFWWSEQWFGRKLEMKPWTNWTKKYKSNE